MDSIETFLARCQTSSQACYDVWKELLGGLETPVTRSKTRRFLEQIIERAVDNSDQDSFQKKHHFSIDTLIMGASEQQEERLLLLNFPSIFTPEDWSFTFFEGLTRYPTTEFTGRGIVELGCGNGWITLALTKRCSPAWIKGLDINPRAVTCAKINAYINFFNGLGHPIEANDGTLLIDKVEFLESDLLGAILKNGKSIDRVIGCIPQVLNPDPEKTLQFVSEMTSDEMLHSLSNYCEKQGYLEDQFGLGLVARAIEESVEVLKPSGKLMLNLGGRPGQKVLERMFTRRGFHVKKVWGTRVLQAADTDIDALVEIEEHSTHRFEFFMGLVHEEPISALAAQAVGRSGGEIGHALSVFEARIRSQAHLKKLFLTLKQDAFEGAKSSLDLSFASDSLVEEKLSFLSDLSGILQPLACFPYEKTSGQTELKRRLAEFFRAYWRIPTTAKSFLVAPNRQELIRNIYMMLNLQRVLVDKELSRISNLKSKPFTPSDQGNSFVLEIPRSAEQICEMVTRLKPQLAVCVLDSEDAKSMDSIKRLIQVTTEVGCLLLLDISLDFEMSSSPKTNALLRMLNTEQLPDHIVVICGLVRNRVYADLEMAFVYSESAPILDALEKMAEITYSRTPLLTQRYYDRILFDLLSFQMPRTKGDVLLRHPRPSPLTWREPLLAKLNENTERSFLHNCFVTESWKPSSEVVRLDYGENEFSVPKALSNAILESYVRENLQPTECDVQQEVKTLVANRLAEMGLSFSKSGADVIVGHGVAPLFAAALEVINARQGCLLFPTGSYGYFEAAAIGHGVPVVRVETSEIRDFKIELKDIELSLKQVAAKNCKAKFIYLNIPFVNPTGAAYEPQEISALFKFCEDNQIVVIADTIFAGLNFNPTRGSTGKMPTVKDSQSPHVAEFVESNTQCLVLGGFSKEFAAGGLRFGYGWCRDSEFLREIKQHLRSAPHATTLYAAKKLLTLQNQCDAGLVSQSSAQNQLLLDRALRLKNVLSTNGWQVLPPKGGLFLVAKPSKALLQKTLGTSLDLTNENMEAQFHQKLFTDLNLLINPPQWTGLPGFFRFVLSVKEDVFERGIAKINQL